MWNVRGNPEGNERRRFSHVTTPHVRRQIFTCRPSTEKGNVEATHETSECGPRLHRETYLLLSLSPSQDGNAHTYTHMHVHTQNVAQNFLPSETLSRRHARATSRLLYHREDPGDREETWGTRKRRIKTTVERLICWNRALCASLMIVLARAVGRVSVVVVCSSMHINACNAKERPVPPNGSRACDGRG